MAEVALQLISRCRVTSISSRVGGGMLGCSWAADSRYGGVTNRKRETLRDATPGGKTEDVDDCGGCIFELAETVAKRSLRRTRIQLDITGRTEL